MADDYTPRIRVLARSVLHLQIAQIAQIDRKRS